MTARGMHVVEASGSGSIASASRWRVHAAALIAVLGIMSALFAPATGSSQTSSAPGSGPAVAALESLSVSAASEISAARSGVALGTAALAQNFPNPFNPVTTIRYRIEKAGMVSLRLYNLLGQEVAMLVDSYQRAGSYAIELNSGEGLPRSATGVYFYRLATGSIRTTRKLVIIQ